MTDKRIVGLRANRATAIMIALFIAVVTAAVASGHGGKHSDEFNQLKALQKATKLYDQLIGKGKLDENWETSLHKVTISKRKHKGTDEMVVSFHREKGEPTTVYIFFTMDGKYAGSNFSGE